MARPVVIRDETIVDAARQVFLERGFQATTLEVAERAGVSEGTLFKRFNSKVELFQAAMRSQIDEPPFLKTLHDRVGTGDLRENLTDVGLEVVSFFRTIWPLIMMAFANPGPGGLPCLFHEEDDPLPIRTLRALTEFFVAEARSGRLRVKDPEVLARAFLGAIHNFVHFQHLFKDHAPRQTPEQFVSQLVDTLWAGVGPSS